MSSDHYQMKGDEDQNQADGVTFHPKIPIDVAGAKISFDPIYKKKQTNTEVKKHSKFQKRIPEVSAKTMRIDIEN